MRRADRLFSIVQILRNRSLTTAKYLAEILEISERTVYRDISDLLCSGVPVMGEAGVGYRLDKSYNLPPLMFTKEEIEALVLGAGIVRSWADRNLARAADQAISKIETVLPPVLKNRINNTPLFAVNFAPDQKLSDRLVQLREAVNSMQKIKLIYISAKEEKTKRTVRPLCLTFFAPIWMLTAWCELRKAFRNFRLDRIDNIAVCDIRFKEEKGKTLNDYLIQMKTEK